MTGRHLVLSNLKLEVITLFFCVYLCLTRCTFSVLALSVLTPCTAKIKTLLLFRFLDLLASTFSDTCTHTHMHTHTHAYRDQAGPGATNNDPDTRQHFSSLSPESVRFTLLRSRPLFSSFPPSDISLIPFPSGSPLIHPHLPVLHLLLFALSIVPSLARPSLPTHPPPLPLSLS